MKLVKILHFGFYIEILKKYTGAVLPQGKLSTKIAEYMIYLEHPEGSN